jgi:hypothetical protein
MLDYRESKGYLNVVLIEKLQNYLKHVTRLMAHSIISTSQNRQEGEHCVILVVIISVKGSVLKPNMSRMKSNGLKNPK